MSAEPDILDIAFTQDDKAVLQEVLDVISINVWSGIDKDHVRQWINQFNAGDERLLGSLILRNLIYRTKKQVIASMRQVLERGMIRYARKAGDQPPYDWLSMARGNVPEFDIFYSPVSWRGIQPGKSGQVVARWFRREFDIPKERIVNPWEFPGIKSSKKKALIFLDDTLGTGSQFSECLEENGLEDHANNGNICYFPLMAHIDGISLLRCTYPHVLVEAAEMLDEKNSFKRLCKKWKESTRYSFNADPWVVYKELLKRVGPFDECGMGFSFGNMDLLLGYEEAVPDNSIPLLWDRSANWKPFFNR